MLCRKLITESKPAWNSLVTCDGGGACVRVCRGKESTQGLHTYQPGVRKWSPLRGGGGRQSRVQHRQVASGLHSLPREFHRSDSTREIGAVQGKKDGHKVAAEHSFPGDALACSLWKVAHCWGGTSIAGA